MGKPVKQTVSHDILDNGTVRFTLTPKDSVGNLATMPAGSPPFAGTPSDPTLITVAVDPTDPSGFGLVQIGTPLGPLGTGFTVVFSSTLASGTVVSGTSDPLNIVAGGPTGVTVSES
jgi:hypothetical protein